jgi:hypothetical protein
VTKRVWDLETVPDLAAAARMLDMGNASEAEVREALGPCFPKHPLHKIAWQKPAHAGIREQQDPKRTRTVQDFFQRKFIIEGHFIGRKSLL